MHQSHAAASRDLVSSELSPRACQPRRWFARALRPRTTTHRRRALEGLARMIHADALGQRSNRSKSYEDWSHGSANAIMRPRRAARESGELRHGTVRCQEEELHVAD